MSQTKDIKLRPPQNKYVGKILDNSRVEWLMEYGKIREVCFFKGAIGDRYTIYVATKRNKNIIDFHTVYNSYDYGTSSGTHIAELNKDYTNIKVDSHTNIDGICKTKNCKNIFKKQFKIFGGTGSVEIDPIGKGFFLNWSMPLGE